MDITPDSIRNATFPAPAGRRAPAYATENVDSFLDEVATVLEAFANAKFDLSQDYDALYNANEALTSRVADLEAGFTDEKRAGVDKSASLLEVADRVASEHITNAEEILAEAEALLERARTEAQEEAARIVTEAREKVNARLVAAEDKVSEVLATGTARRDELAEVIARQEAEIRHLEELKQAKITEIKRSVRAALNHELDDEELRAASVAPAVEAPAPRPAGD